MLSNPTVSIENAELLGVCKLPFIDGNFETCSDTEPGTWISHLFFYINQPVIAAHLFFYINQPMIVPHLFLLGNFVFYHADQPASMRTPSSEQTNQTKMKFLLKNVPWWMKWVILARSKLATEITDQTINSSYMQAQMCLLTHIFSKFWCQFWVHMWTTTHILKLLFNNMKSLSTGKWHLQ